MFTLPKGDTIDTMLNYYINQANCPVPIRKIGDGFYFFGTKKIYAKILNGKLVIRVGGGYMIIEEFIATYADGEMAKISKMSDEQFMQMTGCSQDIIVATNPGARLSMYRNNMQRKSSPNLANVTYKPDARMSGTSRMLKGK